LKSGKSSSKENVEGVRRDGKLPRSQRVKNYHEMQPKAHNPIVDRLKRARVAMHRKRNGFATLAD